MHPKYEHWVFVIDDGKLVEMKSQNYSIEKDFRNRSLTTQIWLAGDQVDSESPRRWLLIKRETAIPSEEDGATAGR